MERRIWVCLLVWSAGAMGGRGATLFYDDFSDPARLKKEYTTEFQKMVPGKDEWVIEGGLLRQKSKQQGDMCYAIITNQEFPPVLTVQAKMRIDEWQDGDTARGGVAVRVNLTNGQGYTFLVHNVVGTIQFLNDWVKWGKAGQYAWKIGEWNWIQMHIDAKDTLYGKMWGVNEKEPKSWQLEQPAAELGAIRPPQKAYPALNGGTSGHGGAVTVSFDEVHVWDEKGPTLPVDPRGRLAAIWGAFKKP